ncbi:hypothetical protein AVEN_37276-1 [Araneus ventricosus]|uniref:Uncharacterized protein n=1 Tax=Araneus ventricosus TaxID=182803 RepID=A0A4Y2J0X3_ARAVE|nr:hypothetical protein AVEN_37276-1 [Araneus ventricosus]
MHLNDSRCDNSSAEAGVLMAITGHNPTAPVEGTHYHRKWVIPSHYRSQQGSETPFSYPAASHPHIHGVPSGTEPMITKLTFQAKL